MSKEKTKEEIIAHKKNAIRKLNALLESYISSEKEILLKKTDLIFLVLNILFLQNTDIPFCKLIGIAEHRIIYCPPKKISKKN